MSTLMCVALGLLLLMAFMCCAPCAIRVSGAASAQRAQLEEHAALARTLIEQRPDMPEAHLQLALALHRLNDIAPDGGSRIPEAEASYRSAILLADPSAAAAIVSVRGNLGALLLSADRINDAIAELDKAISDASQLPSPPAAIFSVMFNRGKTLAAAGRLEEAEAAYLKAARAARGRDLSTYGKALAAMEDLPLDDAREAARVARKARRLMAGRTGLGFLSELDRGWPPSELLDADDAGAGARSSDGLDESKTKAAKAAGSDGDGDDDDDGDGEGNDEYAAVLGGVSGGGKGRPREDAWLLEGSATDLSWLHFAVYKRLHRAHDRAAAWSFLEAGNRLMASTGSYSPGPEREALQHIMDIFEGPFDRSLGYQASRGAIFVVGAPRSGSTLVEQILGAHSQVYAAGEDTLLAPLANEMQVELADPSSNQVEVLERYGRRYLKEMRARATKALAPGAAKPKYIVDKMLMNLWRVGHILLMLPNACIIHAARHPLDTAMSCYAQPFSYDSMPWAWDLGDIAEQLDMTWTLVTHWQSTAPGRLHTVLYEDLVSHPEEAVADLLKACGLGFEPEVLSFHKRARSKGVHTASQAQVRKPLYTSSVGRWGPYAEHLGPLKDRLARWVEEYEGLLQETEARRRRGSAGGGSGARTRGGGGESSDGASGSFQREGGSSSSHGGGSKGAGKPAAASSSVERDEL